MSSNEQRSPQAVGMALALSFLVVALLFYWQGHVGLNLWDEGYLWYGAQRVMLGEVPIRDFQAYDPGRYYWSAALMGLSGDNGIMSLRMAVGLFQALGLSVGVALIAGADRAGRRPSLWFAIAAALILAVWMFPRHKLFDISISVFLVGVLAFLIRHPSLKRHFITGWCVGMAAVFGRNHGMYGAFASLLAIVWLAMGEVTARDFARRIALWGAGVLVGFAPVLLMMAFVPGFAAAFWDSIMFIFEVGATNLELPIPWPWLASPHTLPPEEFVRSVLVGGLFIAIAIFGVAAPALVFLKRYRKEAVAPALVAAACLALPYAHYAYSRSDVGHLAQGIFPFLIGILVLLAAQPKWLKISSAALLLVVSLWIAAAYQPGWSCHGANQCVDIQVSGDDLQVDAGTAGNVELLRRLVEKHAPRGRSFVVTPFWPGAYALFAQKSPMKLIYTVFPQKVSTQLEENGRILKADPGFVLVLDIPLDGRDDMRFKNTHPLINSFIESRFHRVDGETGNSTYLLFTDDNGSVESTHAKAR